MIRRWSHINNINNNFIESPRFEIRYNVNTFKASVSFKRFTVKITKFKRKSMARLKHQSTWLMYTNVIHRWVNDYMFNKHYLRFQFYNKILINNFFFFNFNFINMKNENFFYNFNFYFSTWSKKSYFSFNPYLFNYIKNSNLTFGWFTKPLVSNDSIIPLYSEWDNIFYPIKLNKPVEFNLNDIFDFLFFLSIKKFLEVRKILTLLFYYNIQKF